MKTKVQCLKSKVVATLLQERGCPQPQQLGNIAMVRSFHVQSHSGALRLGTAALRLHHASQM
jgi:hypothetical protein